MAFDGTYLHCLVPSPPGVPSIWSYKTADSAATVDTADYFVNGIAMGLRKYDLILRTTVTNLGASNEAYSTQGLHVVNSQTSTAIDVADAVALSGSDTD